MPKGPGPLTSATRVADRPVSRKGDDPILALLDHCTSAQAIADAQGEKFLSYMLAMVLQAARGLTRDRSADF